MRAAKTPAAWPLSMLLTTTPGEAELSIVSSAPNPPKEPGWPVEVGTATIGTSVSAATDASAVPAHRTPTRPRGSGTGPTAADIAVASTVVDPSYAAASATSVS